MGLSLSCCFSDRSASLEVEDQYKSAAPSNYECLLFDLDDTLYPSSTGLFEESTKNVYEYMVQKLGIEENKASQMSQSLYKNYGTSMAGLKAIGYRFDDDDYHSFVHGRLPYGRLKPDHVLRSLLLSLPMRKVIFSNADRVHVSKALRQLKLEDCFDGVICYETLNPIDRTYASDNPKNPHEVLDIFTESCQFIPNSELPRTTILCKPFEAAFEQAFNVANINPRRTVFFDDSFRNIQTAKRLGLKTVLVGTSNRASGADLAVKSIHNIKQALPELWKADSKPRTRWYRGKVAVETSITA